MSSLQRNHNRKTEFCDSLVSFNCGTRFFIIKLTTTMCLITEKHLWSNSNFLSRPEQNSVQNSRIVVHLPPPEQIFVLGGIKTSSWAKDFFSVIKDIVVVRFIMKKIFPVHKLTSESQNSVFCKGTQPWGPPDTPLSWDLAVWGFWVFS